MKRNYAPTSLPKEDNPYKIKSKEPKTYLCKSRKIDYKIEYIK